MPPPRSEAQAPPRASSPHAPPVPPPRETTGPTRETPDARAQRVIVLARVVGICRGRIRRTRQGPAVDSWDPVSAETLAVELHIDEVEVGVVVREVKRWLRVEMHARGLTPPPHAARELERAHERRRELLR